MTVNAIEVHRLTKSFGKSQVLRGVDLDVAEGEILGLLGPNGAGKTTLVEILEGLQAPDQGSVRVLGHNPWKAPARWRDRIGVVLQETSDAAYVTVAEAVDHFRRYYSKPRSSTELLEVVGLQGQARQRVCALSGGQRRRLDVALAIAGTPDLLFLDEPTTGFDPLARKQFWSLVRDLNRQGTTILLTTHDLYEAEALSDRVAILVAGQIVARGTLKELAAFGARHPSSPDGTVDSDGMSGGRPAIDVMTIDDPHVGERTFENNYLAILARGGAL